MCQVQCLFPGIRCLQINPHANLESLCPIVTSSDSPAGLSLPHQLHPQHSSCPNPFTQQMRTTSLPGTPAHSGVCRDSHVCVLRAHVPPLLGGTTSIPARRTPPAQTEAKCYKRFEPRSCPGDAEGKLIVTPGISGPGADL